MATPDECFTPFKQGLGLFNQANLFYATVALFVFLQLPFLFSPPDHLHTFRQALTAGTARNYYEEGNAFLAPTVLERQHTNGISGMEFPLYQYLLSKLYRLFGFHQGLGKALSLLCSAITLIVFHRFAYQLLNLRFANIATICLAFSTLFFTYSAKVMPETMALMFHVIALRYTAQALFDENMSPHSPRRLLLLAATFSFALATLIKMNMVIGAFYISYLAHRRFGWSFLKRPDFLLMSLVSIVPAIAWYYWYVPYLNGINNLNVFFLGYPLGETLPMFYNGRLDYLKIFFKTLPQDYLGWGMSGLFLTGGAFFYRNWRKEIPVPSVISASLGVTIFYFALMTIKSGDKFIAGHSYYMYGSLPYAPFFVAYSINILERALSARRSRIAAFMIALIIAALAGRVGHTYFTDSDVDHLMRIRPIVDRVVPPGERIAVNVQVNPMLLYFFHRTGWLLPDGSLTDPVYIGKLYARGLRYIVAVNPADGETQTVKKTLSPERVWAFPEQRLFIVKLADGSATVDRAETPAPHD